MAFPFSIGIAASRDGGGLVHRGRDGSPWMQPRVSCSASSITQKELVGRSQKFRSPHKFPAADKNCIWAGQSLGVALVHIGKTGGSTVVKMLEQYEKRGELLFFNQYCGWPQFASQLMERFRHELGLPYGRPRRRRLDGFMHSDSTMVAGGGNGRPAEAHRQPRDAFGLP